MNGTAREPSAENYRFAALEIVFDPSPTKWGFSASAPNSRAIHGMVSHGMVSHGMVANVMVANVMVANVMVANVMVVNVMVVNVMVAICFQQQHGSPQNWEQTSKQKIRCGTGHAQVRKSRKSKQGRRRLDR